MIPVYTHYLSPADYGTLELLELTLDVIILLVGVRLADSIIRYYNHYENPDDQMEVVSTAFLFSIIITIIVVSICLYFVSSISAIVFNTSQNSEYFKWIFFCLGFQLMFIVPETFLLVEKKSFIYSSLSFACFVVSLSLNIYFLVALKYGIWGMIYSMFVTKLFNIIILFIIVIPKMKFSFSVNKLLEMLKFGMPIIPGAVSMFVINFSDRFFIQRFCDANELGIYSLGYKFGVLLIILISDPFFRIWGTQQFEIVKKPDGPRTIGRYFSLYFLGLVFFALGISVFAKDIIYMMAETNYQGSSLIIPLITISYIFQGIANFSTLGIMVTYKTKFILYSHVFSAIINIILNYFLIKNYGIYGAAFSTIITFFILFLIVHAISQKLYFIHFEYLKIIKILLFSGILYLLSLFITFSFITTIIFKIVLCSFFPVFLLVSGFFEKNELVTIKEIFLGKIA